MMPSKCNASSTVNFCVFVHANLQLLDGQRLLETGQADRALFHAAEFLDRVDGYMGVAPLRNYRLGCGAAMQSSKLNFGVQTSL